MTKKYDTLGERLHARVLKTRGCWFLKGRTTTFTINGKTRSARKIFYEYYLGKIPVGTTPQMTCREKRCVNPDHMYLERYLWNPEL